MYPVTDDHVAQVAAARNVVPLAQTFGVKLAAANEMYENVSHDAFYEKLAQAGYVPRTQAEAQELLAVADMVMEKISREAQVEDDHVGNLYKVAGAQLSRELGVRAPEALAYQHAETRDSYDKTAQYIENPEVILNMLALQNARELLAN